MNQLQQTYQYKGLFEAHVSIAPLEKHQAEDFRAFCEKHHCKAIQIVLSRGTTPVQPMSCSRHQGTLESAKAEVNQLARDMQQAGYEVKRLKIEAYPKNQDIPQNQKEAKNHSAQNYFEHHWKVLLSSKPTEELLNICEQFKAHFSKNAFKKRTDQKQEHFITLRLYGQGLQETESTCAAFKTRLEALQVEVLKSITEYCVYDDYVTLDDQWLDTAAACLQCPTPCYDE